MLRSRVVVCIALSLLVLLGRSPEAVRAQAGGERLDTMAYVVAPGDSLAALAARFGTDMGTLQQLNALQDPRQLYVGQVLRMPVTPVAATATWTVALGDDVGTLAQRAGVAWEAVAEVNRAVNPATLLVGQTVHLPTLMSAGVITTTAPDENLLMLALRYGVDYWRAARLNPYPLYRGATFMAPDVTSSMQLPSVLAALRMTSQPVARGQTALISMETVVPAACTVTYLNVTEPCYTQHATQLYAFLGFPSLLDPGRYDVVLRLTTQEAETVLTLPIHVSAGRYDYERIDVPSDRQSLLDPALSRDEQNKIAVLRTLRTSERLWEYPFLYPLHASVTSYYGARRSYGYGFGSYHAGTDFRAERGAPVLSPASGVVVLAEPLVVRGNAILIDHGWGVVSGYWHLSRIDVVVGQRVTQGEILGAVGNTGLSTGPHLHWELWVNGVSVSPLQWVDAFAADLVR